MNNYIINCYYYKKKLKVFNLNKENNSDININGEKKKIESWLLAIKILKFIVVIIIKIIIATKIVIIFIYIVLLTAI